MIPKRYRNIPLLLRHFILVHEIVEKESDVSLAFLIKIAVPFGVAVENPPALLLEQVIVSPEPMEEIRVETSVEVRCGI